MNWIKMHKLATLLIVIVLFLLLKEQFAVNTFSSLKQRSLTSTSVDYGYAPEAKGGLSFPVPPIQPPVTDTANRIVIKDSQLSLLVKDVRATGDKILAQTKTLGGFMVNTSYNRPDELAFGTITLRIPTTKLDEALKYFRSLAIKVTSENLQGTDVTDVYVDLDKRLATLAETEAKFKEILAKATKVEDILQVQQQLISLQDQIDSLKGQKLSLEKQAQYTSVTIYLSTDELALPYAPDEAFRPDVIFKQAVRSLLGSIRDLGELLIWIAVYAVIWIPVLGAIIFYRKRQQRKSQ